jgi:hypothetical protein
VADMQSFLFSYSQGGAAVTPINFKMKTTFSSLKLSLNAQILSSRGTNASIRKNKQLQQNLFVSLTMNS